MYRIRGGDGKEYVRIARLDLEQCGAEFRGGKGYTRTTARRLRDGRNRELLGVAKVGGSSRRSRRHGRGRRR